MKSSPLYLKKTTDFQLIFNFEQTRRVQLPYFENMIWLTYHDG